MEIFDDKITVSKPFGRVEVNRHGWTDGDVVTPHGIVMVYAESSADGHRYTRLDFAFKGRLYIRNFNGKRYSPRGLVTKANQFASEVVGA